MNVYHCLSSPWPETQSARGRMNVYHCLSSPWPGSNSQRWRSISRDFSLTDHTLPTRLEPVWQKMAQSPLNGTAKPVDIKEEGLCPTTDRQSLKGVMSWPKVSSLVFRFWSLPWTNGPNTQLKWKLRYSPILCAYLEPSVMHFSDCRRNRIRLEIGNKHRAVDFSAYSLIFGKSSRRCTLDL